MIARVVAYLVYILSPSLRASIRDNMRHVLGPEASDAELKQATRGVLTNTARNYFDLIKLPHLKPDDIKDCIVPHNWHNVEDALKQGKGVVLVTAHLGSFDTAAQIFTTYSVQVTILVEPLKPPSLLKHVTALRASHGINFVPTELGSLEIMIRALRRGEAILFVCDRDIAGNGLKSNFFGEETTMPTAAMRIAMRTGAVVVPTFNLRRDDGRYDAFFEPAVDIIPKGDGALERNIEKVAHIMERYIESCPEQWVVLSPIWANEQ